MVLKKKRKATTPAEDAVAGSTEGQKKPTGTRKRKSKVANEKPPHDELEQEEVPQTTLADEEEAKLDKRGVIHLPNLPLAMHPQKLRHIMEQFGEVGRIYLAPEDALDRKHRKRRGGNRKQRFTEGWVEFVEKKVAKRVALSLNGNTVGGRKRHNFYRDRVWNVKYLPKFKWYMLHEGDRYNKQVRKARLKQQINQARRETDFFLENVHKAKVDRRKARREAAEDSAESSGGKGRSDAIPRSAALTPMEKRESTTAWGSKPRRQIAPRETTRDISDKLLSALL
mmetsp:Transcript_6771/g.11904  ORF Transcript_6771/g.11904 Transcript_6771/m.11904 type:complete len:283 (-) Transcript_6771:58-906(-)